ncbi:hypothetical protein BpHYR1_050620 [Brachionus plicatilis]|uniref:Uncharacterized protein n=1 Tax=Brachionus plicatilis TaxID=10195 RepID=A0A3M7P2H2_BRAPC|nr:hypothetical protein BpHYR1_050620 [Brachionus plicatilis]
MFFMVISALCKYFAEIGELFLIKNDSRTKIFEKDWKRANNKKFSQKEMINFLSPIVKILIISSVNASLFNIYSCINCQSLLMMCKISAECSILNYIGIYSVQTKSFDQENNNPEKYGNLV